MAEAFLSVCWKGHTSELATVYKTLWEDNFLVDCTISAEGQSLKAHKLVLSASSTYFHMLFREETRLHPFIILLGASFETLKTLIDFVYRGEVQIPERNLKEFLTLAQSLEIKGLNAFSKNYKEKNQSNNTTENSPEGLSEDNQGSCEVESVRATGKGSPEKYCHQRPTHSHGYPDVVHASSSLAHGGYSASCEEVQFPQEDQSLLGYNEAHIESEISIKHDPLRAEYLESKNEILDSVKSNEPVRENYTSKINGRTVPILGKQHLNRYTGCNESTHGNMETSVMPPSHQLMQLNDEVSPGQNVPGRDGPLLPTVVVPKSEYVDDEECDEPMGDPDARGNDSNEADEGMEPPHAERNAVRCLSADGCLPENDHAAQPRSRIRLWTRPPETMQALSSNPESHFDRDRQSDNGQLSGEEAALSETFNFVSNLASQSAFTCDVCGASFSSSSKLVVHVRTHTGERPFSCHVCGKTFNQKANLNRHMKTHTGERPYSCEVCGNTFSASQHLFIHMRTHTGERPYSCTVCSKTFNQKQNLNRHMLVHTGERPYRCDVCGSIFTASQHLFIHMRTHTGERPFSCTVCSKTFNQKQNLKRHMQMHTGERPYRCEVCGNAFTRAANLAAHACAAAGEPP